MDGGWRARGREGENGRGGGDRELAGWRKGGRAGGRIKYGSIGRRCDGVRDRL